MGAALGVLVVMVASMPSGEEVAAGESRDRLWERPRGRITAPRGPCPRENLKTDHAKLLGHRHRVGGRDEVRGDNAI